MNTAKTNIINTEVLKQKGKSLLFYASGIFLVGMVATTIFVSATNAKEDIEFHLKNWEIEHEKVVAERKDLENDLIDKKKEECKSEKKGAGEKLKVNAVDPVGYPLDDKKAAELKYKRDSMKCDF